jgi:predicted nucleic acid-binding protein
LLDTCVISETLRESPSPEVMAWIDSVPEEAVFIPALVVGELQKGVELLPAGARQEALRLWLEQLRARFAGRILPIDEDAALEWGHVCARLRRSGRTLPVVDSLLAALALRHRALFATRNTKDFQDSGATVVNPWGTD